MATRVVCPTGGYDCPWMSSDGVPGELARQRRSCSERPCHSKRSPHCFSATSVQLRGEINGALPRKRHQMRALRVLCCIPSKKEGKTSKCFAERRLRILSPEILLSVIPKLYRNPSAHASLPKSPPKQGVQGTEQSQMFDHNQNDHARHDSNRHPLV
jgi:hypothetical protein